MNAVVLSGPAALTPGLHVADAHAAYWLSQVNLRLRREIGWCWHQRVGRSDPRDGTLPPLGDACSENLDWAVFRDQKRRFLAEDPTGQHLSACIGAIARPEGDGGAWARAADELRLSDAAQFVLALALAQRLDAGLAPVFAACLNDLSRPYPTLALAQRLWDEPAAVAFAAAAEHPLFSFGLLERAEAPTQWQRPLVVRGGVADLLCGFGEPGGTETIAPLPPGADGGDGLALLAWRLAGRAPERLEIVPLNGPAGADFAACAAILAARGTRPVRRAPARLAVDPDGLPELTTLAWLAGADLLLPEGMLQNGRSLHGVLAQCLAIPVRWYLPVSDRLELERLPATLLQPEAAVPMLAYGARLQLLLDGLGAAGERLRETVEECARRFRLQAPAVKRVTASLRGYAGLSAATLIEACRIEAQGHLDRLAQRIEPRFAMADLVLPPAQARQLDEVLRAMRSLTRVHHYWGTARTWNESGLSVLFCGTPGTGKTMAAEALAEALRLELFRIDLSQVVNKYIGETEKNLKRIFDAAEAGDCILFFDEADALFGKRTEVKDSHDRFANIEISYLLERMERFKGLAILASNRRKDLDEAFMRRLRYVVDFPVPGPAERERIWRGGFPAGVDVGAVDFRYLARQFALSGGHIHSVIFNACLQAAHAPVETALPPGKAGRVAMSDILVQLKRELQKLNRSSGDEQFGRYAREIAEWAP